MMFSDTNLAWMRHPKTFFRCATCDKEIKNFDELVEHLERHRIFVMRDADISVSGDGNIGIGIADKIQLKGSM